MSKKKRQKEIDKKLVAGFNHRYEYKIDINEFPQPITDELNGLLDKIEELCEMCGAEYFIEVQNV